jgi:hypothetical protein
VESAVDRITPTFDLSSEVIPAPPHGSTFVRFHDEEGQKHIMTMNQCAKRELARLVEKKGSWQCQYGNCKGQMFDHETFCYRCKKPKGSTKVEKGWWNQWGWSGGWDAEEWRGSRSALGDSPEAAGEDRAAAEAATAADPPDDQQHGIIQQLIQSRKRHRAGKRVQKQKEGLAQRAKGYGESRGRSSTASEEAAAGKSRASGSGAMRHPIAQALKVVGPVVQHSPPALLVAAVVYEGWKLARTARQGAEAVVEQASDSAVRVLDASTEVVEAAADLLKGLVDHAHVELAHVGTYARQVLQGIMARTEKFVLLLSPNTATLLGLVVIVAFYCWEPMAAVGDSPAAPAKSWFMTAKKAMALSGRNPEANVSSSSAASHLGAGH